MLLNGGHQEPYSNETELRLIIIIIKLNNLTIAEKGHNLFIQMTFGP